MIKVLLLSLLLTGCATERLPAPTYTYHVYTTQEGITVILDPASGQSVGYNFHVDKVYDVPPPITNQGE